MTAAVAAVPPVHAPPATQIINEYAVDEHGDPDGSRCRGNAGGVGGAHTRKDGYEAAYHCDGSDDVLRLSIADRPPTIDRSNAQWTVQVGPTDSPTADYPAPNTRTVRAAWFAAAVAPVSD